MHPFSVKKKMLLLLLALVSTIVDSQVPQGFSYQAVIRDDSGTPISNKVIGLRITIQNASDIVLYSETQSPQSNAQGVIAVTIGGGAQVSPNPFSSVTWGSGDLFIKIRGRPKWGHKLCPNGKSIKASNGSICSLCG